MKAGPSARAGLLHRPDNETDEPENPDHHPNITPDVVHISVELVELFLIFFHVLVEAAHKVGKVCVDVRQQIVIA